MLAIFFLVALTGVACAARMSTCPSGRVYVTPDDMGLPKTHEIVGVEGPMAGVQEMVVHRTHAAMTLHNATTGNLSVMFVVKPAGGIGPEEMAELVLTVMPAEDAGGRKCVQVVGSAFCDTIERDFMWAWDEVGYPNLFVAVEFNFATGLPPAETMTNAVGWFDTGPLYVAENTIPLLPASLTRMVYIFPDRVTETHDIVLAEVPGDGLVYEAGPKSVDGVNNCKATEFETLVFAIPDCRCRIITLTEPMVADPAAAPFVITRPLAIYGEDGASINATWLPADTPLFVTTTEGAELSLVALDVTLNEAPLVVLHRGRAPRTIGTTVTASFSPIVVATQRMPGLKSEWSTYSAEADGINTAPMIESAAWGEGTIMSNNYVHAEFCNDRVLELARFDEDDDNITVSNTVHTCGATLAVQDPCLGGKRNAATGECECDRGCGGLLCASAVRPKKPRVETTVCYNMGDGSYVALVLKQEAAIQLLRHPGFEDRNHSLRQRCEDEDQHLPEDVCRDYAPRHAFSCNCAIAPGFGIAPDVCAIEDAMNVFAMQSKKQENASKEVVDEYRVAFIMSLFSIIMLRLLYDWFFYTSAVII